MSTFPAFALALCAALPFASAAAQDDLHRKLDRHRAAVEEIRTAIADQERELHALRERGKQDRAEVVEDKIQELRAKLEEQVATVERFEHAAHAEREHGDLSPEQLARSLRAAVVALKQSDQPEHAKVVARLLERVEHGDKGEHDRPRIAQAGLEAERARLRAEQARVEAKHAEIEAMRQRLELERQLDEMRDANQRLERRVDELAEIVREMRAALRERR